MKDTIERIKNQIANQMIFNYCYGRVRFVKRIIDCKWNFENCEIVAVCELNEIPKSVSFETIKLGDD